MLLVRRAVDRLLNLALWTAFVTFGGAFLAGVGLVVAAATAPRPSWAPEWSGSALVALGVAFAMGGVLGFVTWVTRLNGIASRAYHAKLSLDSATCLATISEFGEAELQPHVELRNDLPERLDFEMVKFEALVGGYTTTVTKGKGALDPNSRGGYNGAKVRLPVWYGTTVKVVISYEIVYGPSLGDRYLIRERRTGITFTCTYGWDHKWIVNPHFTYDPPMTEVIPKGMPK